eukprot:scaffold2003_cov157-Amphora_coffeaeformis.AAC.6
MFRQAIESSNYYFLARQTKRAPARPCSSSTSVGLTALALVLGVSKSAIAFSGHAHQTRHISSDLHATRTIVLDGFDIDASKLPRLFVGNSDRKRWVTPGEGLANAFKNNELAITSILKPEIPITLNDDQSHYLTTVLRLGKKSKAAPFVRLFDESGEEWLAKILVHQSKRPKNEPLSAMCVERLQAPLPVSSRQCWLIVAPTKKKDRLRWMIEKCTELNVAGFVLLDTDFSETPSLSIEKMQAYAIEAAEQSERSTVPHFVVVNEQPEDDLTSLDVFLDAWVVDTNRISLAICRERSNEAVPVVNYLTSKQDQKFVGFVVGPEGGWSPRETDLFDTIIREKSGSIQSVSLGSTILRSETACMISVGAFSLLASIAEESQFE